VTARLERSPRCGPTTRASAHIGAAQPTDIEISRHASGDAHDAPLRRKQEQIAAEAALDGIYVLRTSVPGAELEAPDVVRAYKQLKEVERAFRTLKGRLELRPVHHRLEQRVKAHVFLCMLSYYLA
jgi:transposase